jgi:predicted DNA-binding transcriptional regulator AlpA
MSEQSNNPPPLLLSAEETAALLGICERFLCQMHNSGELGPLPIGLGRRKLWSRFELEAWVQARCPRREVWVAMQENAA